jgi:hypothetical protein
MPEMTRAAMEALSRYVRRLRSLMDQDVAPRAQAPASGLVLRFVLLRQLEACGLSPPAVLTGGWESAGYVAFRSSVSGRAVGEDAAYVALLRTRFEALAADLPGLYGQASREPDVAPSAALLNELVEFLNAPELESAWIDDTALGWVYQFWNDPQREAIDARVGPRGKIAPEEIASKTQLFTERYMIDWLLQNSVGRIVMAMRAARGQGDAPAWPMYVAQATPSEPGKVPRRLTDLRILDPACGSGHFLAGAFDFLVPLYREEAHATGGSIADGDIAANILRHNLHGIDIDAQAVQVSAAVLYLKARRLAPAAAIPPMNLVATTFDPERLEEDAPGSPGEPCGDERERRRDVLARLRDMSFQGTLMRFSRGPSGLFDGPGLARRAEALLDRYAGADELGVRFEGVSLPAGRRLRELLSEHRYDVVVFNPPYLATSKIDLPAETLAEAFDGAPDLFAAFVDRAFELCKPSGFIAFVALSNWMFLSTYRSVRERLLEGHIVLVVDLGKGAFRYASKLIQTAMVVASPEPVPPGVPAFGGRVGSRDAIAAAQIGELARALEQPASTFPFDPAAFARIEGAPLLFWLDGEFIRRYAGLPKIGEVTTGLGGIATTHNDRFLRAVWEVSPGLARAAVEGAPDAAHLPYLKGADGREWIEPFRWLLRARHRALELRVASPNIRVERAGTLGVAYTTIGQRFAARLHSVTSVRDVSGASMFPRDSVTAEELVCALNRTAVRELASAFNPTVNFQLGDVRRLPYDAVEGAGEIVGVLRREFAASEQASELSLDYVAPRATAWSEAQRWAQRAVDRRPGEPLPPAAFGGEAPSPAQRLSHALGVALGRFALEGGIADSPAHALPDGILFLGPGSSSLGHPACRTLRDVWAEEQAGFGEDDLDTYLRLAFFAWHREGYENRPVYLPLCSARRSFVAFVCVHRWSEVTLSRLLVEHLAPARARLEGELGDLRGARVSAEAASREPPGTRAVEIHKLLDELGGFIARVTEVAERGPPPSDAKTPPRERDAPFVLDLEDGIQVNAAGLWSLLEPLWKEPRAWWKQLASGAGKKDQNASRLAARYFPRRVRARCAEDPSLAVAHGCFWELHPAEAFAWELRLKEEIGPDFTIDEPGAAAARERFFREQAAEARAIERAEQKRRARRRAGR